MEKVFGNQINLEVIHMKASIKMIKNVVKVFIFGKMVLFILDYLKMI